MAEWKKTRYCRIVKGDGTVHTAERYYMPEDVHEVLGRVRRTNPGAGVQWLWVRHDEEWRDEGHPRQDSNPRHQL